MALKFSTGLEEKHSHIQSSFNLEVVLEKVVNNSCKAWSLSLYGNFFGRTPPLDLLKVELPKKRASRFFYFNEEDLTKVFIGGPTPFFIYLGEKASNPCVRSLFTHPYMSVIF